MGLRVSLCMAAVCLALLLAGCVGGSGGTGDSLTYSLPTTLNVPLGEPIPGTDITFFEYSEQGARFLIKGQPALKRTGDSLRWSGDQAPGAKVELQLRLVHANATSARLAGTAKIVVRQVSPSNDPPNAQALVHYTGPVAYGVARGDRLPGTTLTYVGPTDDGAELGGLGEYPYRLTGDSILWEGRLGAHASLKLDVRVVQFDERALRVAGLATLWLH